MELTIGDYFKVTNLTDMMVKKGLSKSRVYKVDSVNTYMKSIYTINSNNVRVMIENYNFANIAPLTKDDTVDITMETIMAQADVALDMNDRVWFRELQEQLGYLEFKNNVNTYN